MYRKLVHATVQAGSFKNGAEILAEQAELKIEVKRLWRAVRRIGEDRLGEEQAATAAFEKLPLPAQQQSPVEQVPRVACVEMDGGRLQVRDRQEQGGEPDSEGTWWSEMKVGVLTSMQSEARAVDPCPDLPATFADPGKMRQIASEIKGFTQPVAEPSTLGEPDPSDGQEPSEERPGKPQRLVKSVIALVGPAEEFGRRLASAAYARGFHAAPRKAFVADGSEANWGVHRRHFSHYVPIVDFVHALMYVYAAAMAGRVASEGWRCYRDWAQWLWSGQVERILEALAQRQAELGLPAEKETGTPNSQVAESLRYLTNQRSRMHYAEYRRQGLTITSSYVESTIKQVNRRMKGTEKFWSSGVNAMLTLVADQLSETNVIPQFWNRRLNRIIKDDSYQAT